MANECPVECPVTTNHPELHTPPRGKEWRVNPYNGDGDGYVLVDMTTKSVTGELSGELDGGDNRPTPKPVETVTHSLGGYNGP